MERRSKLRRWWSIAYDVVALVALLVGVGLVARLYGRPAPSNIGVTAGVKAAMEQVQRLSGTVLGPLEVVGSGGHSRDFDVGRLRRPTVILVFKSTCTVCEASAKAWAQLTHSLPPDVQVIGVNVEDPTVARRWLTLKGIRADSVIVPATLTTLPDAWKISAVPVTLTLDSTGRVVYAKLGIFNSANIATVRRDLLAGS